ncbi:MAG TPA: radical SAM protein, partial [Methanomicrobia archaeon]|nr:radical SAM protein [Methanomicrobia archaeon]HEX59501.1 radical SAM protein [Methanomicrobia archaeon]
MRSATAGCTPSMPTSSHGRVRGSWMRSKNWRGTSTPNCLRRRREAGVNERGGGVRMGEGVSKKRANTGERTKIYHVVLFDYDRSLYVFFKGCNFACRGCILRSTPWDCHIPEEDARRLSSLDVELLRTLTLSELERIVVATGAERAVLGGGEPTVDPALPRVVELLKGYGVRIVLLTNGHALGEELAARLEAAGLDEVCVSIKAV